jgi:hypothetical protein
MDPVAHKVAQLIQVIRLEDTDHIVWPGHSVRLHKLGELPHLRQDRVAFARLSFYQDVRPYWHLDIQSG